jgi:A/G-specific adenine glycosylase
MTEFSTRILHWYDQNARILPWRGHPDPYAVWVSEIMLQQTRVETVIPYFQRWLELFPTVQALARAPEQEVLNAWEGLGYYSRARNLHKAAQIVVSQHNGQLPGSVEALRSLPGIGRYTAAAIASIAFGLDVATLDGNLRRVFARVFNVSQPADAPAGEESLWALAAENLPPGRAGDYNQALMDLGATICLPKKPLCLLCPLAELCQARALGLQEQRPVLKPKAAVPHKLKMAAIIIRENVVLLAQRPATGLLASLWEFPAAFVEEESAPVLASAIETEYRLKVEPLTPSLGTFQHTYTHFKLTEIAYPCALLTDPDSPTLKWIPLTELENYPMGKVDRLIAQKIQP